MNIAVRETFCYCSTCNKDAHNVCQGWKVYRLIKPVNAQDSGHPENTSIANETETTKPVQTMNLYAQFQKLIFVFVADVYAWEWYILKRLQRMMKKNRRLTFK